MKKSTRITYIWHRVMMGVIFIISVLGVIFNKDQSTKAEYLSISWQCAKFLIVSLLPYFLKRLDLDIPDAIYIIFIFFCLAHFFCGEILGFFVKVKWWDSALHTFSGMLIALLSFSLINLLNNNKNGSFKLNIAFMALFAFAMTITIGVMWEIIEFCSDSWFNTNMQRAYVSTMNGRGEPLLGQDALADTMKDLILDSIGAGVVCIICIIAVHKKKIKIEDLSFIKKKEKVNKPTIEEIENFEKSITEKSDSADNKKIQNVSSEKETEKEVDSEVEKEIKAQSEKGAIKRKKTKKKASQQE